MSSQATASSSSGTPPVRFGQPSAGRAGNPGFGWSGAIVGVVVVVAILAAMAWSAAAGRTVAAKQPHVFGGELVLEDARPLSVVGRDRPGHRQADRRRRPGRGDQLQRCGDGSGRGRHDAGQSQDWHVQPAPEDLGSDYVLDASGAGVGLGPLSTRSAPGVSGPARTPTSCVPRPTARCPSWIRGAVTAAAKAQAGASVLAARRPGPNLSPR